MSDAEEQVEVPDTEDDPEPIPEPKKTSKLWVVLGALLVLLGGAGAYVYFALWKYEPTALHHVPSGANIVIRDDAAQLFLFKPVREHVWPVLFERAKEGERSRRIERIEQETGVNLPTDLREMVVASIDGVAWVALAGGKLEPGRFVDGLHRVLQEEGIDSWSKDGDLLVSKYGPVIAQADDGTLIIGSARDITEAAVPRSESPDDLPVPTEGAIGFRVSHLAFKHALKAIPDQFPSEPLHAIDEISGTVMLGDEPHLSLEVLPKSSSKPDTLATDLDGMFSKLSLALLLVPHDLYGAKSAISNASVAATEETVRIDAAWPYEPLDKAVQLLAKALSPSKSEPEK